MRPIIIIGIAAVIVIATLIGAGSLQEIIPEEPQKIQQEQTIQQPSQPTVQQPTIRQAPIQQPVQPQETNCDLSYPTLCIPPNSPDLDCGEIEYSNFKVYQPDPHGFDADKDGIGCEN